MPDRKIDWSRVDWSLRDIEIAQRTGLTRERVRQVRRDLQKPESPNKGIHTSVLKRNAVLDACARRRQPLSSKDLSVMLGTSQQAAAIILKNYPYRKVLNNRKHPWEAFNWDLPTRDLAEIWNVRAQSVSNQRARYGKESVWTRAGGRESNEAAYFRAVDAERIKAQRARIRSSNDRT